MTKRGVLVLLGSLAMLQACDEQKGDTGLAKQSMAVSSGLGTCDQPTALNGETATLKYSTTGASAGELELSASCRSGQAKAAAKAPQQVVAYTVPGQGPQVVHVTTITDATAPMHDTIIEVRRGCQQQAIRGECFDDTGVDYRASGSFSANGGEKVYLLVTSFSNKDLRDRIDRGLVQLDVTARKNNLPSLSSAAALLDRGRLTVSLEGADADADIVGFKAAFYRAGQRVDLDGDGKIDDQDMLVARLPRKDVFGKTSFTSTWLEPLKISPALRRSGADQVEISLLDEGRVSSPAKKVALKRIEQVRLPDPRTIAPAARL